MFTAKERDPETGRYYYGARYYDPRTSVWVSVDPLKGLTLNISGYVYCYDNPIHYIDPDGRFTTLVGAYIDRKIYQLFHPNDKSVSKIQKNEKGQFFYTHTPSGTQGGQVVTYGVRGYDGKQGSVGSPESKRAYEQMYGEVFFHSQSAGNGFGNTSKYHGTIDVDWFSLGMPDIGNKTEGIYEASKVIAFYMGFIKTHGVCLYNIPVIKEPKVIMEKKISVLIVSKLGSPYSDSEGRQCVDAEVFNPQTGTTSSIIKTRGTIKNNGDTIQYDIERTYDNGKKDTTAGRY